MFDPKIAISGAAAGVASGEGEELGFMIGREVATQGGIVVTGATSGVPYAAAKGAKSVNGQVIGFSPAHSLLEHRNKYRLPVDFHDIMFFTGYDYAGRDVLLVDMADAMISVSGRIGSLHEFTSAFERHKVIGLLLHSGGLSDMIPEILHKAKRGNGRVVMHADPKELVSMVMESLKTLGHV
ncbi:MAG: hypothetical protein K0S20_750 [Patescibacteria group bacterium]|jgi:uncharacterized protein (TIGR00725 family)|nr:hypothetical protein [Patescibacteria group bacterium]